MPNVRKPKLAVWKFSKVRLVAVKSPLKFNTAELLPGPPSTVVTVELVMSFTSSVSSPEPKYTFNTCNPE